MLSGDNTMIKEIKKMFFDICSNKKCYINIILAIITYTAIILYYNLNKDFSIFFVLVFIVLLIFYFKGQVDISQKAKKLSAIGGGLLPS